MIHFIRPEWLLGLIPAAIIFGYFIKQHKTQSGWNQYIAPHLSQALITETQIKAPSPKWGLLLCWVIAIVALAGPATTKQTLPVFAKNHGQVIAIDMSLSMYADDLTPNRLSHLRFRATDLVESLNEGETGLIAYAGDAFTISPLTRDKGTILNLLPTLSPDIMPVRGSNAASAITLAQSLLKQGGHSRGDIILITDGMSDTQYNQAYNSVDPAYRVSILAVGTQQGSPIKLPDGQFLRDNKNDVIVAKTNLNLLDKLAKQHNGILVPIQTDGSDIESLSQWLSNEGETNATELSGEDWQDLGPYLALLLVLPMLLSFRHGMVSSALAPALLALLLTSAAIIPTPAQAFGWDDLWQTKQQQAQQAFDAGDYQQAAETFTDEQWQASSQYKAGNYEQALTLFEQDTSANGYYNQGNSLMQLQQFEQAISRYEQALQLQPDFTQAQENLELAKQLLEQAQQQDSDQQSSDQQNSDQQKSDEQGSEQQNSDQQGSDNQSSESQSSENQNSDNQSSEQNSSEQGSDDKQQQNQQNQSEQSQQDDAQEQSGQDNQDASNDQQTGDQQTDEASSESSAAQDSHNQQDETPSNESQMQASASAQSPENEQDENGQQSQPEPIAQSQAGVEDETNPDSDSQVISPVILDENALPADMQRALKAVSEDPQVLIRNKMQLEYQKRRQNGQLPKETQQW